MKIAHISDTHGCQPNLLWSPTCSNQAQATGLDLLINKFGDIDVLVHSGDFMAHSLCENELKNFIEWFDSLPFKHKILVPGNHDILCEEFQNKPEQRDKFFPKGMHLLINESVEIDGIKFWGSPYTPWFHDWGFQLHQHEAETLWPKIPDDVDVLITHGPAKGILDDLYAENKEDPRISSVGCPFLLKRINELDTLKAHLFGHIHGGYGRSEQNGYVALNSAIMNERYAPDNLPQYLEITK
ncbi:MAG: metallophosphoesterase [Hydrogenovibrio crunogenus]|uniref:3',5'-cyclic adenosine monophosphate phosphodiesterase CpdA n=1 Tax=Hydrogenovibrio crunogenus TaxID=39765 RepID=A0A4P7NYA8_9GAMM|nr:metallophosphoesterase [Hydrogenovibrio crunogenus]MBD3612812.1 metallophosphoesterase [Hydrogenovibrio crunogenus]QBZ82753.1 3',5'-cyclic adenosine monophosphate phosphodiesterase CpdA [Hydrogenovibrio crunogenus]